MRLYLSTAVKGIMKQSMHHRQERANAEAGGCLVNCVEQTREEWGDGSADKSAGGTNLWT